MFKWFNKQLNENGSKAQILFYHRIGIPGDPFFPVMDVAFFEKQIQYLVKNYRVISLSEFVRRHQERTLDPSCVTITFDDGYKSVYLYAFPTLRRYGVTASVFLVTNSLDQGCSLWTDEVALLFKFTDVKRLALEWPQEKVFPLETLEDRIAAIGQIKKRMKSLPESQWEEIMSHLRKVLRSSRHDTLQKEFFGQMLSWDDVREMHKHGIAFGGHTASHPILSQVSQKRLLDEIDSCKRRIETELDARVDTFAYPNGRAADFNEAAVEILRERGFICACTTIPGWNTSETPLFELKRTFVEVPGLFDFFKFLLLPSLGYKA